MVLVTTSDGDRLNPDAAASYELMNAHFTRDLGKRLWITSGARTHEQQIVAFTTNYVTYNTGTGDKRWWDGKWWWRKRDTYPGQYATVAAPGSSNHEDPPGRAADFGSGVQTRGSREHNWMLANAGAYGWEWTGRDFITVEPWHWEKTGPTLASSGAAPFNPAKEALIVNADDKNWLNGLGQSIIDQINAGPLRADLNTVNQAVQAVRADLNYVHQLSPYSLKTILEGVRGGTIELTDQQVAAISGQLTASAVAGIDAALKDDFDGLRAMIAKQPPEFIAALKSAL